jgi:hypothetical protein
MMGNYSTDRIGGLRVPSVIKAAIVPRVPAQRRGASGVRRVFELWRVLAQISEKEPANRGYEQKPTERGQDKSRQGAARSGCCFPWAFSPFRQGAPDPRKVRADTKSLPKLSFLHIAEAGDGA